MYPPHFGQPIYYDVYACLVAISYLDITSIEVKLHSSPDTRIFMNTYLKLRNTCYMDVREQVR